MTSLPLLQLMNVCVCARACFTKTPAGHPTLTSTRSTASSNAWVLDLQVMLESHAPFLPQLPTSLQAPYLLLPSGEVLRKRCHYEIPICQTLLAIKKDFTRKEDKIIAKMRHKDYLWLSFIFAIPISLPQKLGIICSGKGRKCCHLV